LKKASPSGYVLEEGDLNQLPKSIWELGQTDLAIQNYAKSLDLSLQEQEWSSDAGETEDAKEVKALTADD
jgi:hypothetical protein